VILYLLGGGSDASTFDEVGDRAEVTTRQKTYSSPLQVRLLRISTAILVLKVTDDDSDGGGILIGPIQN
jgi:hypothetical protein